VYSRVAESKIFPGRREVQKQGKKYRGGLTEPPCICERQGGLWGSMRKKRELAGRQIFYLPIHMTKVLKKGGHFKRSGE